MADFNGDVGADMLFRRTDGTLLIYLMNGFQMLGAQLVWTAWLRLDSQWPRLNGDGRADIMFRRTDGTVLGLPDERVSVARGASHRRARHPLNRLL
jgi:hypothetical protein